MKVSLGALTNAVYKVGALAEGQKNIPGVLFDIRTDEFRVCYSDGRKAIISKLPLVNDEGFEGKLVIPWNNLLAVINANQPKGMIFTDEIELVIGDGVIVVEADKKIKVKSSEDEVVDKVVSRLSQKMVYHKPEESVKYSILTRVDYDSIFESADFDLWDKETFRSMLSRASSDKLGMSYISSSRQACFAINVAFVTNIPIDEQITFGFTVSTALASAIVNILSKTPGDKVRISVSESRYVSIVSDDVTTGIWFEMPPGNKSDLAVLSSFEGKEYNKYRMAFCRPALENVLECIISSDNNEKVEMSLTDINEGEPAIKISTTSGGASMGNDFRVVIEHLVDNVGDVKDLKLPINLKVLKDMVNNCVEMYIMFDIAKDDRGTYLRVGDIVGAGENDFKLGTIHYTMIGK